MLTFLYLGTVFTLLFLQLFGGGAGLIFKIVSWRERSKLAEFQLPLLIESCWELT